jgi:PEGA domain
MRESGLAQKFAWAFTAVLLASAGRAAESFEVQRSYSAPVDRVYAAELKAAGAELKRSVERSCTVQFQSNEASGTFYRVMNWTANCRDAGNGSTTVTLAVQMQSTIVWGNEEAKQKEAALFWSHLDNALLGGSAAVAASPASPAASAPVPPAPSSPPVAGNAAGNSTGLAHISCDPAGAEIEVDGEYQGNTPSDVKLKPGSHSLKLSKKGYVSWQHTIKIDSGETRTFAAELQKTGQ